MSDGKLEAAVRKAAYRLDAEQALKRATKAETDRRLTIRPAPDTMTSLNALLPVTDGVAVYAALKQATDTLKAGGDPRTRGQIMADTLVERVTGHAAGVPARIEVRLVMTDHTLLAGGGEPALIPGYGPVPARWARHTIATACTQATDVADAPTTRTPHGPVSAAQGTATGAGPDAAKPGRRHDTGNHDTADRATGKRSGNTKQRRQNSRSVGAWVKRLYTHPETGDLIAMDAHSRKIPAGLAEFITLRDLGICANSYCDAPIRHYDHIRRWIDGGKTSAANLRGLCERCNHAREALDWITRHRPDGTVATTTPTGHTYTTQPPTRWPAGPPRVVLAPDYRFAA